MHVVDRAVGEEQELVRGVEAGDVLGPSPPRAPTRARAYVSMACVRSVPLWVAASRGAVASPTRRSVSRGAPSPSSISGHTDTNVKGRDSTPVI